MPLYFFDVTDTGKTFRDDQGTELASLEEARHELPNGDDHRTLVISIRQGSRLPSMTVELTLQLNRRI
jgi:hypothetical protein